MICKTCFLFLMAATLAMGAEGQSGVSGGAVTATLITGVKGQTTTSGQEWLLAVSKVDHQLAIVDPVSLTIVARVPIGEDPHEVIASADGRTAYVSNAGYGAAHEINVIDLVEKKALPSIETLPLLGPHGLAFVGGKLWFTVQGSKSVARYDPQAGKIDWTMGTGQNTTHMIYISPDQKNLCTTNVESGTVSIFDYVLIQPTVPPTGVLPPGLKPHMDWMQTVVPVGKGAEGFDVSPDGHELWTATPDGKLEVVDLDKKELALTLDANIPGAHRLKFTPDGKFVMIVSVSTGDFVVYSAVTRKEVKRMKMERGASMMVDKVGNRCFVACTPDNVIVVVNCKTFQVTGRLDVGGRPDGLAITGQ